jgi:RNA polymerase sigma-70 factor, ECF subfamily
VTRSNYSARRGVLLGEEWPEPMHERAGTLPGSLVSLDSDLAQEFEARLLESSTLAFRVAYGVLRHREDAEDVAQEAFTKAYRNFRQLRDRDRFRAWLVRLTWRLAVDRQRSDRRRANRDAAHVDLRLPEPSTVDEIAARQRADRLWAAVDALPDKLRVVIVLSGIEGHNLREVARLLGLAEGTVKSRMFAARHLLKERLQCAMRT